MDIERRTLGPLRTQHGLPYRCCFWLSYETK